jgi:hypothetical protein
MEIEIDPFIRRSPFGAAHHAAIKGARGGKVIHGEGEVEWGQAHGFKHSLRAAPVERLFLLRPVVSARLPPCTATANPASPTPNSTPWSCAFARAGFCILDSVTCVTPFSVDTAGMNG